MKCKDDDGVKVGDGDSISFSYGLPPVRVIAKISERDGRLIGVCEGNHKPKVFRLRSLRRYVGGWYIEQAKGAEG